jgi:hypothetical protein
MNYLILDSDINKFNCDFKSNDRLKRVIVLPLKKVHGSVTLHDGETDIEIYSGLLGTNKPFTIDLDIKVNTDLHVSTGSDVKCLIIGE